MVRAAKSDTTRGVEAEDLAECFYLIDENKGAELQTVLMAMRGVKGLIGMEADDMPMPERSLMWAIFDVFEKRISAIADVERCAYAYIDPANVKRAVQ